MQDTKGRAAAHSPKPTTSPLEVNPANGRIFLEDSGRVPSDEADTERCLFFCSHSRGTISKFHIVYVLHSICITYQSYFEVVSLFGGHGQLARPHLE